MQRHVHTLAPHTRRQAVHGVVRQFHRLLRRSKGHGRQHRPEDFLLRHNRRGMHVAQQRRLVIKTPRRHDHFRLPARCSFRDSLSHEPFDSLQLHAGHNRANIDGLVERRTHAQRVHPRLKLLRQLLGDAFLHQQPRTRAAHLPLVEPDAVHETFHGAVEIRVFENDERRLSA